MGAGSKALPMARKPAPSDEDEEELEDEEEAPPPRRSAKRSSRKPPPRGRPRPIRLWARDGDPVADEPPRSTQSRAGARPRIFWRARDSLYFAPLVALAIVILLIVSLFAFTQNWPPIYVVESESMQHGTADVLGVINTGDLVLAQKVPNATIQTYVVGHENGYSTYGEFGDVLLYEPNGVAGTPIIHRAILYLQYDPGIQGYTAPSLANLPCGNESGAVYATPGTTLDGRADCAWSDLTASKGSLDLFHVGWSDVNVTISLSPSLLGMHSGFVTMGDNNIEAGEGTYDQSPGFQLSQLVEPGWVIGVARGMIPWVGALKLWIEGSSTVGEVPPQSWQFLGLSVAGIILLAFGLHYALRAEGIEDPRRKAEEEDEDDVGDEPDKEEGGRARHFLQSLRPWGSSGNEDAPEPDAPAVKSVHRARKAPSAATPPRSHRGRPPPKVRRPAKSKRPAADDEDL
jgi:signal peptidase